MTIIPRPHTQPQRPYQDQLPEGATVEGWDEDKGYVVWKRNGWPGPFPDAPFNVHPVSGGKISGSGIYDLTAAEATALTGIPLRPLSAERSQEPSPTPSCSSSSFVIPAWIRNL